MGATSTSGLSAIALAASLLVATDSNFVQAFPVSRIPSAAIANTQRRQHIIKYHALPPSIGDDVDSDQKDSSQMESLRKTLFAELEKMRTQFAEMSESLSKAKEREERAQGTVATLKEEQRSVEAEKAKAVDSKKTEFV